MKVDEHIESFDDLYARLGDLNLANVHFPLEDIESFRWNRGPWNDAYYNYHYRRFTCHLLSRLDLHDKQSVLVVGCGFGLDEKNIRALFPSVELWSIDVSQQMVAMARAGGSPSQFALALAEQLPFPDQCFDRVLSREVIEHVIDPSVMLKEIHRVLKPDGVAVVTTENEESLGPTNFYDSRVWPVIAAAAGIAVPDLPYKDEAPSVEEMKVMAARAGLILAEQLYDGALYKYLIELSSLLKGRIRSAAHYFSCLENGARTAPLFCDQVKYVLRKPGNPDAQINTPRFECVSCRASLEAVADHWRCSACGAHYAGDKGVPDFRRQSAAVETMRARAAPMVVHGARMLRWPVSLLSRYLRRLYCAIYVAAALLASTFVPKNRRRPSGQLDDDDRYARYIKC